MGDKSSAIYDLRPVTFTLKNYHDKTEQYGLIAEEVAEVMPNLVIMDKNGLPQTVKYQDLPALLLNEIKNLRKHILTLEDKVVKISEPKIIVSKDLPNDIISELRALRQEVNDLKDNTTELKQRADDKSQNVRDGWDKWHKAQQSL